MNITKAVAAASIAAMVALGIGACGGSATPTAAKPVTQVTTSQAPAPKPVNPVKVLRQTGATVPKGEPAMGGVDGAGVHFASGLIGYHLCRPSFSCGEGITVKDLLPGQSLASFLNGTVTTPNQAVIAGHGFVVTVTPVAAQTGDGVVYHISPQKIASRVHGYIVH